MYVWSMKGTGGRSKVIYTHTFHSALSLSELLHVTQTLNGGS